MRAVSNNLKIHINGKQLDISAANGINEIVIILNLKVSK